MAAPAGGLHAEARSDVPAGGRGVALREASCLHTQPRAGTRSLRPAHACPGVSPGEAAGRLLGGGADAPGPVPPPRRGVLSLEHPGCARGRTLVTGRESAAPLRSA